MVPGGLLWGQSELRGGADDPPQGPADRHIDIAKCLDNLAGVQYMLKDYRGAKASDAEALAIRRKALPKDHPDIAEMPRQPRCGGRIA